MRLSGNKSVLEPLLVSLLIALFGIFYWQTIMTLPLFGDATIHGSYAKEVLESGWKGLSADYPAFYYYLMAAFYSFFGEKGFNLVVYIGLIFLLLSTYVFIRYVTKNKTLSLFSIIIVGASPKIIFYSARMYQEILISAVIIFTIYLLIRYFEVKDGRIQWLLILYTAVCISIKQQGLFVLFSSFCIFYGIQLIRKKIHFSSFLLVIFVPIFISLYYYGVLFHNKGYIQPGSDEFKPLKIVNSLGKKLFLYQEQTVDSEDEVSVALKKVETEHSTNAYSRAESRHIWPWEVITDFEKFNQANNLYIDTQGKPLEYPFLKYFSITALVLGFLLTFKYIKRYSSLLLFTIVFVSINYALFIRNNDQQRYHLFLPIFLSVFIFLFLHYIQDKFDINKYVKYIVVTLFIILIFTPIISSRTIINLWWINSQAYSPSIGGINSVKEVGEWFKNNTNENVIIGQQCGNEMQYYSDRQAKGDWRAYFFEAENLKKFFQKQRYQYYVISQSQIVEDQDWKHICWVPKSFYNRMKNNFPQVFESSKKDIYVFKIQ